MQPTASYDKQDRRIHRYLPVKYKFWLSHCFAFLWLALSIYLSIPWIQSMSSIFSITGAILIIMGIAYIPGYMNAFLVISLILDKQPDYKDIQPKDSITVLIAAYNEKDTIYQTIQYVAHQDYQGPMKIIVIDNDSNDGTAEEVIRAKKELGIDLLLLTEKKNGKFNALNHGLSHVDTPYVITLDADTLLHSSAVRFLAARMKSSPDDVSAVAGAMHVRNSRNSIWTKIQEWEYFLSISSIKRMQGLYQGTLVAQGAFSLYDTARVREAGGWPDAIGEDIVLTWRMLRKGCRVYFEPLAVAFTDVPVTYTHLVKQRARWARGMIEGLREIKPWRQPRIFTRYLTGVNLIMPYIDLTFTLFWIPGLVLSFFGVFWIVGPMALFVLPITFATFLYLFFYQKNQLFKTLQLRVRKNLLGFILFIFCYQTIMSPVYGYVQEAFNLKRVWK